MKHWDGWEKMCSEVPEFKLCHLNTMQKFTHEVLELPPYYEQKPCLTTQFLYWSKDKRAYDLDIRFIGVSSLKLEMYGDWQLHDIQIRAEAIEEIQFYVDDYEDKSISFYCERIEYLGVKENVEENLQRALKKWRTLIGMGAPKHTDLERVLEVLKDFTDRPVVAKLLLDATKHENIDVQDAAYEYLWYLGDPWVIKLACDGLKNDDVLRRITCIEILGRWGEDNVLPLLFDVVKKDVDSLVRCYAGEAIGAIGEDSDILALQQLFDTEEDDVAKIGILYGLELLGYRDFEGMCENLANDNYIVRIRAVLYLSNMALQDLLILEQTVEILKKHRDLEETVAGREAFDRALQELVG
ncbi:HEAT repeat domain-containing protein [Listeria weihenstephanensis]|uniref:HEAT repeat domain-containing protein n=1 Tax=Listeria weihenstephanensis TaxID=1006155 RepID=A0A841Z482_9LIST|nr:HEAT repeat domain-containing protein [Listeria weihenstephanensis]MBC1500741.1 HEAT repeat domain-containing protein [Listeria weihenstephanensis]